MSNRTSIDTGRSCAIGGGSGPASGSGLWYDLGPHLVDQALRLFGLPDRVMASLAAQRPGAQSDDWAHVILEYGRLRVILHASVLVAAPLPRFIVHGHGRQLDQIRPRCAGAGTGRRADAGTTPDRPTTASAPCWSTARQRHGDRDADSAWRLPAVLRAASGRAGGIGSNPVPPEQVLPVMAVLETAVRSSAEGRALPLPLTDSELRGFSAPNRSRLTGV